MASSSLLDFITTLVHDPAAAAAYRADPQSALSAANLHDVTTADIDHLIPVVAESSSGSVWSASNAAHSFDTTSFDAGAFDTASLGGNPFAESSSPTELTATVDDSSFDAGTIPDSPDHLQTDWGGGDTTVDLSSNTSSIEFDHTVVDDPASSSIDADWSGASSIDDVDAGSHDAAVTSDGLGFDHF